MSDMDPITSLLLQYGINISSAYFYDLIKNARASGKSQDEIRELIKNSIHVDGAELIAERMISVISKNGHIQIENTTIDAGEEAKYEVVDGASMAMTGDSLSRAGTSSIATTGTGKITMEGNARIHQRPDGTIELSN